MPRPSDENNDNIPYKQEIEFGGQGLASTGYGQPNNNTMSAGRGGYSNPTAIPSSNSGTPTRIQSNTHLQSETRIQGNTPSAPPNRMVMPVDIVPPQRDLVPLWDGSPIYGTPDTPASPLDCNRWPSSPYCGGNPFDWKPIGINVDAVNDGGSAVNKEGCNIGIQVGVTVAFIKMPPTQIVARNPWCKPEPPLPPPKEEELPEGYEFDLGTEGVTQYLEFAYVSRITGLGFDCSYNRPEYPAPTGFVSWDETPTNGGNSPLYRWLITGVVNFKVTYGRQGAGGGDQSLYLPTSCYQVSHTWTNRDGDGYGKTITIRNGTKLLFSNSIHTNPKYYRAANRFTPGGSYITRKKTNRTFNISVLRLDSIPLDVDYYNSPPPPPPWEPPPPPPEPRQRRDAPEEEECECMCCNDGNTEALIALLMKQNAALQSQNAAIQQRLSVIEGKIPTNTNNREVDLTPVLNETANIRNDIARLPSTTRIQTLETNIIERINNARTDLTPVLDETRIIKEEIKKIEPEVDLSEVLDKLDTIITTVGSDDFAIEVETRDHNGDTQLFVCGNLPDLISAVAKMVGFTSQKIKDYSPSLNKIIELIGEPVDIKIFDETAEERERQQAVKKPLTIFDGLKLATERTEVVSQTIGIQLFPMYIKPVIDPNDDDDTDRDLMTQIFDVLEVTDIFEWAMAPQENWNRLTGLGEDAVNAAKRFLEQFKVNKVNNIAELIKHQMENAHLSGGDDGFPAIVEADEIDADEDIVCEDASEAAEELITITAGIANMSGKNMDLVLKLLAETTHSKYIAAQALDEIKSIRGFLGFPTKTEIIKIPTTISIPGGLNNQNVIKVPNSEDIDELATFLQPTELTVAVERWTGQNPFNAIAFDIRQMAAISRGGSERF